MQKASLHIVCASLIFASAAACSSTTTTTGIPTIEMVTPSATEDGTDTNYDVTLVVDFDDSDASGDLVNEFTFQTTNLTSGEVDDSDTAISPPSASPLTITDIEIPVSDVSGVTSVDCTLVLVGTGGAGAEFDFTLDITSSREKTEHGNPLQVTVKPNR